MPELAGAVAHDVGKAPNPKLVNPTPPTIPAVVADTPSPPGPKPAIGSSTPQPPLVSPPPPKPLEDPPNHLVPPPSIDLAFERSKDRLREDLATIDKHSPSSRIPPAKYPFFVPYIARTVVQNALDRNMQLKEAQHTTYLREVDEVIMMLYPLLVPALIVVQEAVEKARLASVAGLSDARPEEKTLAFEQAILAGFEELKALEFPHTELTEEGVNGINICKLFVSECYTKLVRRIEFRKKRNEGLLALVNMSPAANSELQEDKAASEAEMKRERPAQANANVSSGIAV